MDIAETGKMRELVTNYPKKIDSIFTSREINFCKAGGFKRFSVIFAAKEAVLKSLSTGWERGGDLLDIEIFPLKNSRFKVRLSRRLEQKARELTVKELMGSFSYSKDIVVAQVMALK